MDGITLSCIPTSTYVAPEPPRRTINIRGEGEVGDKINPPAPSSGTHMNVGQAQHNTPTIMQATDSTPVPPPQPVDARAGATMEAV